MSKKTKEVVVEAKVLESVISISDMFGGKDLLKDASNLNTKLNVENHYFQDVHRLDPEGTHPFYYVVFFDAVQYKGGPYKTSYEANRACTIKLYELYNLEDEPVIKCEVKKEKVEMESQ